MKMHVIISNGGNESIALIQWAFVEQLPNTYVVTVETGWSAPHWADRIRALHAFVKACKMTFVSLDPPLKFQDLVRDRASFPSQKFQWCAGLLKGVPILTWLDEEDPEAEAVILIGHRRDTSRAHFNLPEWIEVSERYGDRPVWHPLVHESETDARERVAQTSLDWLKTRALECDPCIHCSLNELKALSPERIDQTTKLEQEIGKSMFAQDLYGEAQTLQEWMSGARMTAMQNSNQEQDRSRMDMGCGSPYGCGT